MRVALIRQVLERAYRIGFPLRRYSSTALIRDRGAAATAEK
jgi:hypothetical protein